ncbi:MAG: CoA-binding protein [bacterium]|nr:CoA-binding protein [bacterium]
MTASLPICDIIKRCRTVAVVGLSPKPERESHQVGCFLQARGYRIIPVNPGQKEILGEPCYGALTEIPEPVEVVNVFRRSEAIAPIAEEAMQIGARVFWMQLGIRNDGVAEKLRTAGVTVVMDRCIKIDYLHCYSDLHQEDRAHSGL